ncbi:MAG TPA: hypothetical protein VGD37_08550 [Kofleriaceae bacterium]
MQVPLWDHQRSGIFPAAWSAGVGAACATPAHPSASTTTMQRREVVIQVRARSPVDRSVVTKPTLSIPGIAGAIESS